MIYFAAMILWMEKMISWEEIASHGFMIACLITSTIALVYHLSSLQSPNVKSHKNFIPERKKKTFEK